MACAIDTEGCIVLGWFKNPPYGNRIKATITINNNNKDFIDNLRAIIGTGSLFPGKSGIGFRKGICWALTINRRMDVINLLEQVFGFLIVKKNKAQSLLRFFEEYGTFLTNAKEIEIAQATASTLAGRGLVKMERAGIAWRYQA